MRAETENNLGKMISVAFKKLDAHFKESQENLEREAKSFRERCDRQNMQLKENRTAMSGITFVGARGKPMYESFGYRKSSAVDKQALVVHGESYEEEEIFLHTDEQEVSSNDHMIIPPRCQPLGADEPFVDSANSVSELFVLIDFEEEEVFTLECNNHFSEDYLATSVLTNDEHILNRIHIKKDLPSKRIRSIGDDLMSFLMFGTFAFMLLVRDAFRGDVNFKTQFTPEVFDPGTYLEDTKMLQPLQLQSLSYESLIGNDGYHGTYGSVSASVYASNVFATSRRVNCIVGICNNADHTLSTVAKLTTIYKAKNALSLENTKDFSERVQAVQVNNMLQMLILSEMDSGKRTGYGHRSDTLGFAEEFIHSTSLSDYPPRLLLATGCKGYYGCTEVSHGCCESGGLMSMFTSYFIGYILAFIVLWRILLSYHHGSQGSRVSAPEYFDNTSFEVRTVSMDVSHQCAEFTSSTSKCNSTTFHYPIT